MEKLKKVKVPDKQFLELLQLNGCLLDAGNRLVSSIESYGGPGFSKSLNMQESIENWRFLLNEYFFSLPIVHPKDLPQPETEIKVRSAKK